MCEICGYKKVKTSNSFPPFLLLCSIRDGVLWIREKHPGSTTMAGGYAAKSTVLAPASRISGSLMLESLQQYKMSTRTNDYFKKLTLKVPSLEVAPTNHPPQLHPEWTLSYIISL
jgi:hypothetical protein